MPAPPSRTPVADALLAMARAGDFSRLATDLELPGPEGTRWRAEVRGDGAVQLAMSGAPLGRPDAREVGTWAGKAASEALLALVKALADAKPDALPAPREPEDAVLRVQADRQTAIVAPPAPALPALAAAFEACAALARPVAVLTVKLVARAEGDDLSGEIVLAAQGTEPLASIHPSSAAQWEALHIARGGQQARVEGLPPGPREVLLAPGKTLAVPLSMPMPEGEGPLVLRWTARWATLENRIAGRRAVGGTLVSTPVTL